MDNNSNLFPIFLIGFLILIIFLLQQYPKKITEKFTTENLPKKHPKNKDKNENNNNKDENEKLKFQEIKLQKKKSDDWHKNKLNIDRENQLLFSNQWINEFKQYNQNKTSTPSSMSLSLN